MAEEDVVLLLLEALVVLLLFLGIRVVEVLGGFEDAVLQHGHEVVQIWDYDLLYHHLIRERVQNGLENFFSSLFELRDIGALDVVVVLEDELEVLHEGMVYLKDSLLFRQSILILFHYKGN